VTLDLSPGWNFISLPAEPADNQISSVFAPIAGQFDQLYRLNPVMLPISQGVFKLEPAL
jgi:hypothetical protein